MTTRREERERGFSLVELLIVVVIMGIVVGVISATLILGMQLGPQTRNRTKASSGSSLLTNALSDDVANSSVVVPGAANQPCTVALSPLTLVTITNGPAITYKATITAYSGTTNSVTVARRVGAVDTDYLTGYCTQFAPNTFQPAFASNTLTMQISLATDAGKPGSALTLKNIRFGGAQRNT